MLRKQNPAPTSGVFHSLFQSTSTLLPLFTFNMIDKINFHRDDSERHQSDDDSNLQHKRESVWILHQKHNSLLKLYP